MDQGKTTLELLLAWEQLLYPIVLFFLAFVGQEIRQEFRIRALEQSHREQHRVSFLEDRYRVLHDDHQQLEKKVDGIDGKVNKIVGILSMVHPDAARTLED